MKASSGNNFYDAHAKQYVNVMTSIAKWNRVELPTALLPGGGLRHFENVRNRCSSSSSSNNSSNSSSNSGSSTSSSSCGSGIANKHGAIVPAFQPQRQEQEQQQQQEQEQEPEQAENARQPDVRDLFSSAHVHSTPVWLLTMGGR
jgi:hypothetical protein